MPSAATWMDLEVLILNEVSQTNYHMTSLISIYVESKIWYEWTQLKKKNRNKLTDTENKSTINKGERDETNKLGVRD